MELKIKKKKILNLIFFAVSAIFSSFGPKHFFKHDNDNSITS